MKKIKYTVTALLVLGFAVMFPSVAKAEEATVLFGFESGLQGWDVPSWAYEKTDHVQKKIALATTIASEGKNSLEVEADFTGGRWTGAIVEIAQYFDWSDYKAVACDVYIPKIAPQGLKATMILTVGDTWRWVEMSKTFDLEPGKWVTVKGDLLPGSIDWRKEEVNDAFRKDVRKVDIRVHSNNNPVYKGTFYIDNVRVIK